MNLQETIADPVAELSEQYGALFDNLSEVAHPSFCLTPEFGHLMQTAITRGTPLTVEEVQAEFGEFDQEM